jgi:hypothetical protein
VAGLAGGFGPQFVLAFGGRVRLGGQQAGVDAGSVLPTAGRPAERGAVGRLALAEQQVVRCALDYLAVLEAGCLCARAPRPGGSPPLSLAWM